MGKEHELEALSGLGGPGRPVALLDGAMGTELMARGLKAGQCSMLWNSSAPDKVADVHQAYIRAGARVITTNTFSGSPLSLRRYGLESKTEELNREGARLARAAAGSQAFVLGDIGPCTEFLEPFGDLEPADLAGHVRRQAEALLDGGIDGFLVETMADVAEAVATVEALLVYGKPVWCTFTFEKAPTGLRTMTGASAAEAVASAFAAGASASGGNCGTALGLEDYLGLAASLMRVFPGQKIILQPNAGAPQMTPDGPVYVAGEDDFARFARRATDFGVSFLGGCCGTQPFHIEAMAKVFASS